MQSFQGLLDHLGSLTRNTCTVPGTDRPSSNSPRSYNQNLWITT